MDGIAKRRRRRKNLAWLDAYDAEYQRLYHALPESEQRQVDAWPECERNKEISLKAYQFAQEHAAREGA